MGSVACTVITKIANLFVYTKELLLKTISFLRNTIGITYTGEPPTPITIFVEKVLVPSLCSQPLQNTQKLLEETERGAYFQLEVVNNPELTTLILGYSDIMSIVAPTDLKNDFINRLKDAQNRYEDL